MMSRLRKRTGAIAHSVNSNTFSGLACEPFAAEQGKDMQIRSVLTLPALTVAVLPLFLSCGCCGLCEYPNVEQVKAWIRTDLPPGASLARTEEVFRVHGFDPSFNPQSREVTAMRVIGVCAVFLWDLHTVSVTATLNLQGGVDSVRVQDQHHLPI